MPVNSGAMPEAPLGAHTTQFGLVPVPLREPEADRPPPVVAVPLEEAALDPRVLPPLPPPPVELAPPRAPAFAAAAEVDAAPVDNEFAEFVVVDVVVPNGVAVPVGVAAGGAIVGSVTAPPPAGKPLRVVALPTAPAFEVAVCAEAGAASANAKMRTRAIRVMPAQRNT